MVHFPSSSAPSLGYLGTWFSESVKVIQSFGSCKSFEPNRHVWCPQDKCWSRIELMHALSDHLTVPWPMHDYTYAWGNEHCTVLILVWCAQDAGRMEVECGLPQRWAPILIAGSSHRRA